MVIDRILMIVFIFLNLPIQFCLQSAAIFGMRSHWRPEFNNNDSKSILI